MTFQRTFRIGRGEFLSGFLASIGMLTTIVFAVEAEQLEDRRLKVAEFGGQDLCCVAGLESVPLDGFKHVEDPARGRFSARAAFRVERERTEAVPLHCLPKFALQKRLHHQTEKVNAEQRLDP